MDMDTNMENFRKELEKEGVKTLLTGDCWTSFGLIATYHVEKDAAKRIYESMMSFVKRKASEKGYYVLFNMENAYEWEGEVTFVEKKLVKTWLGMVRESIANTLSSSAFLKGELAHQDKVGRLEFDITLMQALLVDGKEMSMKQVAGIAEKLADIIPPEYVSEHHQRTMQDVLFYFGTRMV